MSSITRLSPNSFQLTGMPRGMRANLDDEAYYASEDDDQAERARDQRSQWLFDRGYDVTVDADGKPTKYYPGLGLALPNNPVTRENEQELYEEFLGYRIAYHAAKLPAYSWAIERKMIFTFEYEPQGWLRINFALRLYADEFARHFEV